MYRFFLAAGLGFGLLLAPLTLEAAMKDPRTALVKTGPARYAYTSDLYKILGAPGEKCRKPLLYAATLFDIPVDVMAASVKAESGFRDLALAGTADRSAVGLAQVTLQAWLQAGRSEKLRKLGLAQVFSADNFQSASGGHHQLYNLLCHANTLRYLYEQFLNYPLVHELPFDPLKNAIGWLVAIAMYNGGERILSTIYDESHEEAYGESDRVINWDKVTPEDLVRLLRHGRGYHADWSRNSVGNHLQKVINNLNNTDSSLANSVPVDIERRALNGRVPPPQRIYKTLNPGYNK
ncbi:MAG: hypothetical protein HYR55_05665 [Acidobacteria bacterium]|nr:hypothetical protein [Acidobacteriota bacterium]MBI3656502.1 hypothetical protein [Acidobacteriota bacterium]